MVKGAHNPKNNAQKGPWREESFSKNIEPGPINITEVFFALPLYDLQHRILVANTLAGEPLDVRGDKTGSLGGIRDN